METKNWETEAAKGRKIRDDSINKEWLLPEDKLPPQGRLNVLGIPEESGLLSAKEIAITNSDATGLVKQLGSGELSAEEVTVAFLKRATIGHQLLNNVTEFMTDDAIAQARALDEYYAKHKKLIGPLHGVPISTKVHYHNLEKTASLYKTGTHLAQRPQDQRRIRRLR